MISNMSTKSIRKTITSKIKEAINELEAINDDMSTIDPNDEGEREALVERLSFVNDAIVELIVSVDQNEFDDQGSEIDDESSDDDVVEAEDEDEDDDSVAELDAELTFENEYPSDDE